MFYNKKTLFSIIINRKHDIFKNIFYLFLQNYFKKYYIKMIIKNEVLNIKNIFKY